MNRAQVNAFSTVAHQLVATICGMIIPWIMIDTFGSTAYGATTSIAQFLSYISLFEGGIGRVARGALYKPLADGDVERVSKLYLAIKRFFRTIGIAFMAYSVILAFFYYDIADVTEFTREYVFVLVIAISIGKLAEYMGGISNITLFNADRKQYVVNSTFMITNVLNVILIIVLANSGVDIIWVKLVSSLVFVLRPIIYTAYLKTHYKIKKFAEKTVLPNQATGIAQHSAYVIQNNTDVLLLTVFSDLSIVAVYSVYHLIVFSLRNIVISFTGGMEAVFGNLIAKGENDKLNRIYEKYKLILTALSFVFFSTAAILVVPFVKIYTSGVTDADYIQPVFGLLLVISEALNCLILPCFNLTIAANKLKESQVGAYGEAAINLALSLVLIFWDPLLGVVIGTLASTIFKCVYYAYFSGKYILKKKIGSILQRLAVNTIAIVLVSLAGMRLIGFVTISNYCCWAGFGVALVCITGILGILICMCLYPESTKQLFKTAMRFFDKKGKTNSNDISKGSPMYDDYVGHDIAAYACYIKNEKELLECSSGGVATALARQMINNGGYVAGVSYSVDFSKAVYEIADNLEQLERFKGSKYVEVDKKGVYNEVKNLLDSDKDVLFFGLPCTVAALKSFLKSDYEKLITVELICHGPTVAKVHSDYVRHLETKYNSKIVDFSVKKKINKWTPGYLYAKFADGSEFIEQFYHTEYGYGFSVLAKNACYSCKFRGNNRTGDIMIGDFWGANEEDRFWNENGVSSVLVHSEKGHKLLLENKEIALYRSTFERIVEKNQNVIKPRQRSVESYKFEKLLKEHELFYAVKHSRKFSTKIKSVIKKALRLFR